jgi:lipoprotein-anchoring transpeptidase ErfK/SrfK
MKRAWIAGFLIAAVGITKFGYDYFYFDVDLRDKANTVATASPSPSPSASNSSEPMKPIEPLVPPTKIEVQQALATMAIPVGDQDGKWGARTRQALCIWRELTGRDVNRNLPTLQEQYAIVAQEDLYLPKDFVVGLNVNKTCQSVVWLKESGKFLITIASTGAVGMETDTGIFTVQWRVDRWYESIAFPDGWMYRPMFFNRGEAVHGSEFDTMVLPYPASHGCVRMLGRFIDGLWAGGFGKGDKVRVYGNYNPVTADPKI